jgi:hypothetical protein
MLFSATVLELEIPFLVNTSKWGFRAPCCRIYGIKVRDDVDRNLLEICMSTSLDDATEEG